MTDQVIAIYNLFLNSTGVSTDTRKIEQGKIFFALKGENFNGNQFANQSIEQGALWCVIDEPQQPASDKYILVDDVLKTLQQVANYHRRQLKIPVLGITGSNGKTTSKELCAAVLSEKYKTLFTQGNLNNHIGVPLTLLSITNEHEFAVIEMGANHQKEIELLCSICEPTHGFITNVGKAHLEGFGGFEGVVKGKTEMYQFLKATGGTIFCNSSNPHLYPLCVDYKNVITYSTAGKAWIHGQAIEKEFLSIKWAEDGKTELNIINTHLTGSYNFENVLAAICVGKYFGVGNNEIKHALENYVPSNQRSQVIRSKTNTIILDAYNANPTSMLAALNNLENNYSGKKVIVLGDMFELGNESLDEHKNILQAAINLKSGKLILVGKWFKEADTENVALHFATSTEACEYIKNHIPENATILIKGSRSSKMEVVMQALSG